jgi:hypothetical protein
MREILRIHADDHSIAQLDLALLAEDASIDHAAKLIGVEPGGRRAPECG